MKSPLRSLIRNEYNELMKLFCMEIIGSFVFWVMKALIEFFYANDANAEEV